MKEKNGRKMLDGAKPVSSVPVLSFYGKEILIGFIFDDSGLKKWYKIIIHRFCFFVLFRESEEKIKGE